MKLSDTQLVILSAACARDDRLVLPLPERLKGNAAAKVIESLIAKSMIEEVDATLDAPLWRERDDGHRVTLVATDAALAALGIEPDVAPTGGTGGEVDPAATDAASTADNAPTGATVGDEAAASKPRPTRRVRDDSKQAQLIAMLKRPEGATIAEIAEAFGWLHHTIRGAIAGALKKKLGLAVTSEKIEGRGRLYRIAK